MRICPGKSQGGPGTEQVEQESEGTIGNRSYFDEEGKWDVYSSKHSVHRVLYRVQDVVGFAELSANSTI